MTPHEVRILSYHAIFIKNLDKFKEGELSGKSNDYVISTQNGGSALISVYYLEEGEGWKLKKILHTIFWKKIIKENLEIAI